MCYWSWYWFFQCFPANFDFKKHSSCPRVRWRLGPTSRLAAQGEAIDRKIQLKINWLTKSPMPACQHQPVKLLLANTPSHDPTVESHTHTRTHTNTNTNTHTHTHANTHVEITRGGQDVSPPGRTRHPALFMGATCTHSHTQTHTQANHNQHKAVYLKS